MRTGIDWTQPIELDTNPPRPAKVVDYDRGLYCVRAEWSEGFWDDYQVRPEGVAPHLLNYPRVRNVVPSTDHRDELIAELVEAVQVCLKAEQRRAKKLLPGAPASEYTWGRIKKLEAAIAKAEGRS